MLAGTCRCGLWVGGLGSVGYWRGLTRRVVHCRWGLSRSAFKAQGRKVAAARPLEFSPACGCFFKRKLYEING